MYTFCTIYQFYHYTVQIERYASDLESLKDDMRDLFGDWEDAGEKSLTLERLGGMNHLNELCEETNLVKADVAESVENFNVRQVCMYICVVHTCTLYV